MNKETLVIKRRGDDGTRVISVRLNVETIAQLDKLSAECNYSRNELIKIFLDYAIENVEIE